mgnify:CR=1 FL=1
MDWNKLAIALSRPWGITIVTPRLAKHGNLNYISAYAFPGSDVAFSSQNGISVVRGDVTLAPLSQRYRNMFLNVNKITPTVIEQVCSPSIKQVLVNLDPRCEDASSLKKLEEHFVLVHEAEFTLTYVRKDQVRANTDTIFVTCYVDFREDRGTDRKFETNLQHFSNTVRSGINLHVFVSENLYDQVMALPGVRNCPHIVVETITLEELECYQHAPGQLPDHRTTHHDTAKFLILQNAKVEIVKRAIDSGRYKDSTHFSWIDFSIFHVISDTEAAVNYLGQLGHCKIATTEVILPGCWGKCDQVDNVAWRFCGGFFLGSRAAILEMYEIHKKVYRALEKLTWEVNVWGRMEVRENWKCAWFKADHNDSIIRIPSCHVRK